ncbi:competence protein ComK [Cytobacillus praedii]|uniref:competence protein ComK n=1 Tax=Cytobacillus praedii TaxID=1742358 RepID=UPI002E1B65C5|nr:competence protein ComK [Cytobacillus praedii]MED3552742.1 competence protein ComK [Cytobacillus praedii]
METRNNYLINEMTVLLYGVWNEYGELFTFIIDGTDSFFVTMQPIKLIDKSIICYGSSLKGALESAKKLLGENRHMYPIKVDALLDIWLFPTKSYKKDNCIWFALNHVKNTKAVDINRTKVFLNYGHEIEIIMRESSFRNKRGSASDLRDMIFSNTKKSQDCIASLQEGLIIIEEKGQYKWRVSKKDEL